MKYKIAILGAGNVAWHLAPALENIGHEVMQIYARDIRQATKITERLYMAEPTDLVDFSESNAEIFILAVTDSGIPNLADEVILPEGSLLVHTSGSQPLSILGYSSASFTGIMYPLQSFTKGRKLDFAEVPFLIESEDDSSLTKIRNLATSLSGQVYDVKSTDRKAIHIAAVFASNFTNHLIRIAEEIIEKQGLDFEILKPLLVESLSKTLEIGAKNAQTGPASRADVDTLEDHLQFLRKNDTISEIYRLISQDIMDR